MHSYRRLTYAQYRKADDDASSEALIARNVIITSESRDRMNDIVRVSGANLDNFLRNPVVQFGHGMTSAAIPVVGKARNLRQTKTPGGVKAWASDIEFAPTALGSEAGTLFLGGFMSATSIGFRPLGEDSVRVIDENGNVVDDDDLPWGGYRAWKTAEFRAFYPGLNDEQAERKWMDMLPFGYGREFLKWELLEFSVVPVPANQDAVAQMRSMPTVHKAMEEIATPAHDDVAAAVERMRSSGFSLSSLSPESKIVADKAVKTLQALAGQADALLGPFTQKETADDRAERVQAETDRESASRVLRETSVETCGACGGVAPYHRGLKRLLTHPKEPGTDKVCIGSGKDIDGPAKGLTYRRFTDLLARTLLHDVENAREETLKAGITGLPLEMGVEQMATRIACVKRKLADIIEKEGRVLSARNRAIIQEAVAALNAAGEALQDVLDAAAPPESDDKGKAAPAATSAKTADTLEAELRSPLPRRHAA